MIVVTCAKLTAKERWSVAKYAPAAERCRPTTVPDVAASKLLWLRGSVSTLGARAEQMGTITWLV